MCVQKKIKKPIFKQNLFRIVMLFIPIGIIVFIFYFSENKLKDGYYENYFRYSTFDLGFKNYWENPDIQTWPIKANKETGLFGIRGGKNVKILSSKYRILCIGDSFTYGFLLENKESFPYLLESKLGKEKFEVLNSGYPGWETTQEYGVYINAWYKLKPDIVILQHYANDIEIEDYFKIKKINLEEKYKDNIFYKKFYIFKLLFTMLNNFNNNYSIHLDRLYSGDQFQVHANSLLKFKESVEKNGTKFVLLLIPSISYKNIIQAKKAHSVMVNFCKMNNIKYIDPSSDLLRYTGEEIMLSKYDIHFNKKGNQILADTIFSYLMRFNNISSAKIDKGSAN